MLPFEHVLVQKVIKGQTRVNIEHLRNFEVENITVKLQHDAYNCRGLIVFTRQPDYEQV